jgi:hypothetical protein
MPLFNFWIERGIEEVLMHELVKLVTLKSSFRNCPYVSVVLISDTHMHGFVNYRSRREGEFEV